MIIKPLKALFASVALSFTLFSHLSWANAIQNVRVWPSPHETRVVIDTKDEPVYSYFSLANPNRLVVDLKESSNGAELPIKLTKSPVLSQIRKSSPPESSTYRLVFDLKQQAAAQLFKLAPTPGGQYGHRLVIDLAHASSAATISTHATNTDTQANNSVRKDITSYSNMDKVVIAIDAGHGGEDPGSIGPTRKYEKNVTLAVAKRLAAHINRTPGMQAVLTRNGDYFVNLNRRSEIARKNRAHLLVSIHADAFNSPKPRGASVFVLNTRRANTEIGRWVENHEKQSQLLGGAGAVLAKNNNDRNVSQTLLDLQFSHSQKEGYKLATDILHEIGKVAYLHKRQPVNASLAVLKSPDIPSVLVETGFISNPNEEQMLFQSAHQEKLARAITNALTQYLKDNPPENTLFAHQGQGGQHKVQRGEALSVIAQKYGTSTRALIEANHLKSSAIHVGLVLTIPGAGSANHHPATAVSTTAPVANSGTMTTKTLTHVVVKGDFLGKIAEKYHVSVADLKRENNLRSDTLKLGQKLRVTVKVKAAPVRKYKVQRGDYLGKIADKHQVSIQSIRDANQLRSDNVVVGQTLIIPNP